MVAPLVAARCLRQFFATQNVLYGREGNPANLRPASASLRTVYRRSFWIVSCLQSHAPEWRSPLWRVPQFAGMRLFPQLVLEKYVERVFDVLVPRNRIVGGSKIIDQVVQPHLFLRAKIKYWSIISFDVLRLEIIIISVRKTNSKCGNCHRKKSGHSRRHGHAAALFSSHFFFLRIKRGWKTIRSTLNLASWLIKNGATLCAD